MIDALDADAGTHPFLYAHQSRTLIYQGLGRSARSSIDLRRIFNHLLSISVDLWKKDQTACAAFLLSRTDDAPNMLRRSEVERIGLIVSRQLTAAVGSDYTASFIYAPILLVGLLRWRLVDPLALVAGRDPTADKMLEGLDAVIARFGCAVRKDTPISETSRIACAIKARAERRGSELGSSDGPVFAMMKRCCRGLVSASLAWGLTAFWSL